MADIKKLVPYEEWKDVIDFEDLYEVSSLGNIKRKGKSSNLRLRYNKDGYFLVNLSKNNVHYTKQLHRVVAKAFINNSNNYPCVNHIDENKSNNCCSNLEWCSIKYNNNYGSRKNNFKKPVTQIGTNGMVVRRYESMIQAAKLLGISAGGISNVLKGKSKTAGGFNWINS